MINTVNTVATGAAGTAGGAAPSPASEPIQWVYSAKAVAVLAEYKSRFPKLFKSLSQMPFKGKYTPEELLGPNGKLVVDEVMRWMQEQTFFGLPRTPFSTTSMSMDAIHAVERAADVRTSFVTVNPPTAFLVKNVPVEALYCSDTYTPMDAQVRLVPVALAHTHARRTFF